MTDKPLSPFDQQYNDPKTTETCIKMVKDLLKRNGEYRAEVLLLRAEVEAVKENYRHTNKRVDGLSGEEA